MFDKVSTSFRDEQSAPLNGAIGGSGDHVHHECCLYRSVARICRVLRPYDRVWHGGRIRNRCGVPLP